MKRLCEIRNSMEINVKLEKFFTNTVCIITKFISILETDHVQHSTRVNTHTERI